MSASFVLNLVAAGHVAQSGRQAVKRWLDRQAARRRLAELDDRDLRDLAISPGQADYEISKPFWKE